MLWKVIENWGSFPEEANERAARLVALFVALLSIWALLSGWTFLVAVLFIGFCLRVWRGPQIDPLARVAVFAAPRMFLVKEVPGTPKRFAQFLGALLTGVGSISLLLGIVTGANAALLILFALASLEAVGGVCLGCKVFALLVRRGLLPEDVCKRCAEWAG